jgi:hypothetical protein
VDTHGGSLEVGGTLSINLPAAPPPGTLLIINDVDNGLALVVDQHGAVSVQADAGSPSLTVYPNSATRHSLEVQDFTGGITLQCVDDKIGLFGATPIAQPGAISPPAGGAVVDAQARTAITSILSVLGAAAGGYGLTA